MRRFLQALILTLSLLITTSLCESSATYFCKCACKGNSTIIALNPKTSSSSSATSPNLFLRDSLVEGESKILEARSEEEGTPKPHHAKTCNDCNRKLCLSHNLPRCKGVKEEEIFTTCFQRDSVKDEAVVFIFIFATAGLLVWALVKPYVQKWLATAQKRRAYTPLSAQEENRLASG